MDIDESSSQDNPLEDQELKEMIERALQGRIGEKKTFKKRRELARQLGGIISEYLDSYILLGYDFSGRHIDIKSASTPMQVEALNSFLIKYFAVESQQFKADPNGPDQFL